MKITIEIQDKFIKKWGSIMLHNIRPKRIGMVENKNAEISSNSNTKVHTTMYEYDIAVPGFEIEDSTNDKPTINVIQTPGEIQD